MSAIGNAKMFPTISFVAISLSSHSKSRSTRNKEEKLVTKLLWENVNKKYIRQSRNGHKSKEQMYTNFANLITGQEESK